MLIGVNWPTLTDELAPAPIDMWDKIVAFMGLPTTGANDGSWGEGYCIRIRHDTHWYDYQTLAARYPKLTFIIRWYWPSGSPLPDGNVLDARRGEPYLASLWTLRQRLKWLEDNHLSYAVELGNEVNLELPADWPPERAMLWWQRQANTIAATFPGHPILLFSLSPNDTEPVWWEAIRTLQSRLTTLRETSGHVAAHTYFGNGNLAAPWTSAFWDWPGRWQALYSGIEDLWLTEVGETVHPASQYRAEQYIRVLKELAAYPNIRAVCLWTLGSDDPQFAQQVLSLEECQIIGAEIRKQKEDVMPVVPSVSQRIDSIYGQLQELRRIAHDLSATSTEVINRVNAAQDELILIKDSVDLDAPSPFPPSQ